MNIVEIIKKYLDFILYAVFGILTTSVNVFTYWIAAYVWQLATVPSTVIAWICAVLFAYLTNRKWVFHSEAASVNEVFKEIFSFFICRLATGVLDWAIMFICVDVLYMNDVLIKLAANILVIVLNYVASRLVVFKHK